MDLLHQQRTAGVLTIVSGILALGCMLVTFAAVHYNADALADPMMLFSIPGLSTGAVRWSMVLDMFGYYLLLLPAIYLLHDWMKRHTAWSNMITFCGLAYVLIGSIGASVLAVTWPRILAEYPMASPAQLAILKADFQLINDLVYGGLWNLLEMSFAACWWIGTGYQLLKRRYRFLGWLTLLTGVACLGDAKAGILDIAWLHELSLNLYLLLAIKWAIVLGIVMLRKKLK